MFTPSPHYPLPFPPQCAAALLLADRVEGLLTRFCDTHPDEKPELLIRAARAVWNLTAVRKTIYLFSNPGADRRHKRGKSDATMTFIEHRVQELHDWVTEYQRLVRAVKAGSQFVVTPSGGSSNNSSSPFVLPPSDGTSSALGVPPSAGEKHFEEWTILRS